MCVFCERARKDVECGRAVWKSPAQGLLFNSASKEEITSNKSGFDCDLHCSCSVIKQNEVHKKKNGVFCRSSF